MTGHGIGECSRDGIKIVAELTSVNRKQSEIVVSLPRGLEGLELRARDFINKRIARGRIMTRVTLRSNDNAELARAHLNKPLAKAYAAEMRALAAELGLPDRPTLDLLMRAPGVLQSDESLNDAESYWPSLEKALGTAMEGLVRTRRKEGLHLEKELRLRVAELRKSLKRIRRAAPEMAARYREQLRERVAKAGLETPSLDDERLAKEVVYFADRTDITEEMTRLESHFQQFDDALASPEPVGRTLDFLAQEMNREINTIGSKAADGSISKEVVAMKTELEKFREQLQNVE